MKYEISFEGSFGLAIERAAQIPYDALDKDNPVRVFRRAKEILNELDHGGSYYVQFFPSALKFNALPRDCEGLTNMEVINITNILNRIRDKMD